MGGQAMRSMFGRAALGSGAQQLVRDLHRRRAQRYRALVLSCFLLCVSALSHTARAGAALFDWCLNISGDAASACNTGTNTPSLPANVNGSGFDFTLGTLSGPNNNTFGSIAITLGPGNGQYVLAYMDYDVNFDAEGSYTDVGSARGAPPPGVSYELDDPGASNIFSDFATNVLTDTNNVGTPGTPANPCCDVSWALAVGGLAVIPGQTATVTFTVGTSPPASGFYLQQSNETDAETIYLSETTTISPPPSSVPEPSALAILGTAIFGFALARRRR
jgi:hypothetical protein